MILEIYLVTVILSCLVYNLFMNAMCPEEYIDPWDARIEMGHVTSGLMIFLNLLGPLSLIFWVICIFDKRWRKDFNKNKYIGLWILLFGTTIMVIKKVHKENPSIDLLINKLRYER